MKLLKQIEFSSNEITLVLPWTTEFLGEPKTHLSFDIPREDFDVFLKDSSTEVDFKTTHNVAPHDDYVDVNLVTLVNSGLFCFVYWTCLD